MSLAIGVGLGLPFGGGSTATAIAISAASVAEDATSGTAVGVLSVANGSGTYTFAITADPDAKFAINGDGVTLETDATLDYETATTHLLTVEADNGVDDPITRIITVYVTNVFEAASLNALTLSASTIEEGSAEDTNVGTIQSTTGGSSLSLIDDASGRFKIAAGSIVAGSTATSYASATSHDITIRETLADSANSPRDTTLIVSVTEAAAGPLGDGILLSDGSSYLLASNGDYIILS